MTGVIADDRFRRVEKELSEDPIIVEMASEIREALNARRVQMSNFVHSGSGTPRWRFIRSCIDEYRKRGGTIESHIGGPAHAIVALLRNESYDR